MLAVALLASSCSGDSSATTTMATPTSTQQPGTTTEADEFSDRRAAMVEEQIVARGVIDPLVIDAMADVPRHRFVPEEFRRSSYDDRPLPIGFSQTISQPYIVALMTELLVLEQGDKVLEIGTGSGYQVAILAAMGMEVYTIEIIPELADRAATVLAELGYDRLRALQADGYFGWEEHAPFDAIIVTAAPDHVPQPLIQQLAPGGRLVIPVGPVGAVQTLWRFTVDQTGEPVGENFGGARFVPFTRG